MNLIQAESRRGVNRTWGQVGCGCVDREVLGVASRSLDRVTRWSHKWTRTQEEGEAQFWG